MLEDLRFIDEGGECDDDDMVDIDEDRLALLLLRKDDENKSDASDDVDERRLDEALDESEAVEAVAMEEDRRSAGRLSS